MILRVISKTCRPVTAVQGLRQGPTHMDPTQVVTESHVESKTGCKGVEHVILHTPHAKKLKKKGNWVDEGI